jgi:hypothetical protein
MALSAGSAPPTRKALTCPSPCGPSSTPHAESTAEAVPTEPIAGAGDFNATVGTKPHDDADSGTWTAGTIQLTTLPEIKAGVEVKAGDAVAVYQAKCKFDFAGKKGNSQILRDSTVTLIAAYTVLRCGGKGVLLHGAAGKDKYGNELSATSTRPLRSA